jgi:hypothetical protein
VIQSAVDPNFVKAGAIRGLSQQARGPTSSPHAGLGASDAVSGCAVSRAARKARRRTQIPADFPGTPNFRKALTSSLRLHSSRHSEPKGFFDEQRKLAPTSSAQFRVQLGNGLTVLKLRTDLLTLPLTPYRVSTIVVSSGMVHLTLPVSPTLFAHAKTLEMSLRF